MAADTAFASPVAATGSNLATFLGNRLSMSFVNLGPNPAAGQTAGTQARGGRAHRFENPSDM